MKILILIFITIPTLVLAQINQTDSKGRKQGKWEKKYENSNIKQYTGNFKDDKPIGTFYYYYPTGNEKAIMVHSGNISRITMYHENGVVFAVGKYINQVKDSVWTYYDSRGYLSYKETYLNGKYNGERTIYYVGEKISEVKNYKNGVLEGKYVMYFENGKVKQEGTYHDGNKVGREVRYYKSGKKEVTGQYRAAVKFGFWTHYNENGTVSKKVYYKDGKIIKGAELEKELERINKK